MTTTRELNLDEYRNQLTGGARELKKLLGTIAGTPKMESSVRLLRQIEYALWRMDRGRYGLCVKCDGEIDSVVLDAAPWAVFCADCQRTVDELQTQAETRRKAIRPAA